MFGAIMIKTQKCSISWQQIQIMNNFIYIENREKIFLLIWAINKHIQNKTIKQPLIYPFLNYFVKRRTFLNSFGNVEMKKLYITIFSSCLSLGNKSLPPLFLERLAFSPVCKQPYCRFKSPSSLFLFYAFSSWRNF